MANGKRDTSAPLGTRRSSIRVFIWVVLASMGWLGISLAAESPAVVPESGREAAEDLGIELDGAASDRGGAVRLFDTQVSRAPVGVNIVPATVVVQVGDTPPGGGGDAVTSLNSPFTDGSGKVGLTGALDDGGSNDNFVWYDAAVLWRNSDSVTPVLAGAESTMGVGNAGEFIYSPSVDGEDAVWSDSGLVAVENTQAPGFPAGTNSTFHSRPTLLPSGQAYWVAGFNDAGGAGTLGRVLFTSPTASSGDIAVVLRSDDIVGGFTIDRPNGIDFDYQVSDNALHHIQVLLMDTGSTADDGFVYVDGGLVARESEPTGEGDNWDNFDIVSINDSGHYLFTGDTDGGTASDEFIAYDGVIGIREGDTVGGVDLTSTASLRAASLNNLGEAVHLWGVSGGDEILFYACDAASLLTGGSTVLLRTGDMVDVDGGGADATVTDFTASSAIGPGLWLAEDGQVHVGVELDYGAGGLEAILALDLLGCEIFADGFESGDTSAWSGSVP